MLGHDARELQGVAPDDGEHGRVGRDVLAGMEVPARDGARDGRPERDVGEPGAGQAQLRLAAPQLGLGHADGGAIAVVLGLGDAHAGGELVELDLGGFLLRAGGLVLRAGHVHLALRHEGGRDQLAHALEVDLGLLHRGARPAEAGLEGSAALADLLELGPGGRDLRPRPPHGVGARSHARLSLLHGESRLPPVLLGQDLAGLDAIAQVHEQAGDGARRRGAEDGLLPGEEVAGGVHRPLHGPRLDGRHRHGGRAQGGGLALAVLPGAGRVSPAPGRAQGRQQQRGQATGRPAGPSRPAAARLGVPWLHAPSLSQRRCRVTVSRAGTAR